MGEAFNLMYPQRGDAWWLAEGRVKGCAERVSARTGQPCAAPPRIFTHHRKSARCIDGYNSQVHSAPGANREEHQPSASNRYASVSRVIQHILL
jgi:hypothetical protein